MTWNIGAILTLGIFLVLQLIGAVAWASAMNTKMDFMLGFSKDAKLLNEKYRDSIDRFSTKEEVATALVASEKARDISISLINREMVALWKQVDALKAKSA